MRKLIKVLLACWFATVGVTYAQTLDSEMSGLAAKISKTLATQGYKSVAAIDFTDLQGQPTELGRFLSEELAVEIVSTGGVSMVDRANIKSILAEHKLTEAGLVDPANAKKLGEFAGVDAILIGNATALDDGIVLMVKAIATSSARIVAAGRIKFPKTSEIQQLLNRGISSSNGVVSTTGSAASSTSYQDANAIATKDIGSLRVILKSVLPMKVKDQNGRNVNSIRCSFEFVSRETQRPIVVAFNAMAPYNISVMGNHLRSTLVDENGGLWRLNNSDVTGMSIVGVGQEKIGRPAYDPTQIVTALSRRDDLNSDEDTGPVNGGIMVPYRFIFGSTTEMSPGQSLSVAISFTQEENQSTSGPPPKVFQIASEIVVGIARTGTKNSYTLHNLTFDRVSISTKR